MHEDITGLPFLGLREGFDRWGESQAGQCGDEKMLLTDEVGGIGDGEQTMEQAD